MQFKFVFFFLNFIEGEVGDFVWHQLKAKV